MKELALVLMLGASLAVVVGMAAAAPPDASRRPDASAPPARDGSGLPDSAAPRDAAIPDAVPPDASPPAPRLKITTFDPKRASIGELVTLTGDGFLPSVRVTHGGLPFPVKQVVPTQIVVVVPVGARGTHRFVVADRRRSVESNERFEVLPPTGPRRPPATPKEPLR